MAEWIRINRFVVNSDAIAIITKDGQNGANIMFVSGYTLHLDGEIAKAVLDYADFLIAEVGNDLTRELPLCEYGDCDQCPEPGGTLCAEHLALSPRVGGNVVVCEVPGCGGVTKPTLMAGIVICTKCHVTRRVPNQTFAMMMDISAASAATQVPHISETHDSETLSEMRRLLGLL